MIDNVYSSNRRGRQERPSNTKEITPDTKVSNPAEEKNPFIGMFGKSIAKAIKDAQERRNKTNQLYGQSQAQTGADVQKVKQLREKGLTGEDPMSDYIRRSSSRRLAAAKGGREGSVSGAEMAQLDRQTSLDLQQNYTQNLTSYQSLIGNMLSGQASYDLGQQQVYNAQNASA